MAGRSKSSTLSFVETRWKPFTDLVERGRLRRGKALAKQGGVKQLTARDGWIQATVRSGGFSESLKLTFPAVGWWHAHMSSIALWFARRPDWLAALLAGEWDAEFIQFLDDNEVYLFPDSVIAEDIIDVSRCDCSDFEVPCMHVVAAVHQMIANIEANPLCVFTYVGVDADVLLDRIHETTARLVNDRDAGAAQETGTQAGPVVADADAEVRRDAEALVDADACVDAEALAGPDRITGADVPVWLSLWPEETAVFQCDDTPPANINHVIAPRFRTVASQEIEAPSAPTSVQHEIGRKDVNASRED